MGICYIVGAGDFFGDFSPKKEDLVIAADGGYGSLAKKNIRCDLLLGDMDSLKDTPKGIETLKFKVEKDETDMRLAYLEGVKRGYTDFALYGGVGGRADHTFANYCLLAEMAENSHTGTLYDEKCKAFAIKNNSTRVVGKANKTVSVFAFGGDALGVDIKGLYYELTDGTLSSQNPLGVSNHITDSEGEVSVKNGTLLIMQEI